MSEKHKEKMDSLGGQVKAGTITSPYASNIVR